MSKNEQVYICNQKGKKYGAIIYVKPNEAIPKGYINLKTALDKKIFTKNQLLKLWTLSPNGYATQFEAWDYFESLFDNVDIVEYLDKESIRRYYYDAFKNYKLT